ncbi:hypothetical protein HQ489_03195 [Candidatus Woesearchaeota archaeon]|nr:hypothetical protein [Candidatus Woesearchaeota archaeon]
MAKDYGDNDYKTFVQNVHDVEDLGELERSLFTDIDIGTPSERIYNGRVGDIEIIMRGDNRAILYNSDTGNKVWVTQESESAKVFYSILGKEIRKRTGGLDYDDHEYLLHMLEKNRDK